MRRHGSDSASRLAHHGAPRDCARVHGFSLTRRQFALTSRRDVLRNATTLHAQNLPVRLGNCRQFTDLQRTEATHLDSGSSFASLRRVPALVRHGVFSGLLALQLRCTRALAQTRSRLAAGPQLRRSLSSTRHRQRRRLMSDSRAPFVCARAAGLTPRCAPRALL